MPTKGKPLAARLSVSFVKHTNFVAADSIFHIARHVFKSTLCCNVRTISQGTTRRRSKQLTQTLAKVTTLSTRSRQLISTI